MKVPFYLSAPSSSLRNNDSRIECLQDDQDLAVSFIRSLFGVLYEVYSSSVSAVSYLIQCKFNRARFF